MIKNLIRTLQHIYIGIGFFVIPLALSNLTLMAIFKFLGYKFEVEKYEIPAGVITIILWMIIFYFVYKGHSSEYLNEENKTKESLLARERSTFTKALTIMLIVILFLAWYI